MTLLRSQCHLQKRVCHLANTFSGLHFKCMVSCMSIPWLSHSFPCSLFQSLVGLQLPVIANETKADPIPIALSISLSLEPLRLWQQPQQSENASWIMRSCRLVLSQLHHRLHQYTFYLIFIRCAFSLEQCMLHVQKLYHRVSSLPGTGMAAVLVEILLQKTAFDVQF